MSRNGGVIPKPWVKQTVKCQMSHFPSRKMIHATTGNVGNIRSQESTLENPNFTILSPLKIIRKPKKGEEWHFTPMQLYVHCTSIYSQTGSTWIYHLPWFTWLYATSIASWAALPLATPVWHTHRHCSSRLSQCQFQDILQEVLEHWSTGATYVYRVYRPCVHTHVYVYM